MNCNEIKNLLFEADDLNEIMADKQLQSHVNECSKCRAALKYEQKLREGFASIAQQKPPAAIAAKIIALSEPAQTTAQATPWWQYVIDSLAQISFKTAAVSCLVGFMAAMFVFRQNEPTALQQDLTQVKKEVIREIATEIEPPPATEPEVSKIETQAEADMIIALKQDEEVIPGAESSFSIHDETDSLVSNRLSEQKSFAMSRSRAAAPSMSGIESFDSETSPPILFSKLAEATGETTAREMPDPRAIELEKLLQEAGIKLQPGQLDLSLLAMRGLISSEKLIPLRPAPGSHWFVEEHEGKSRIILKSNK